MKTPSLFIISNLICFVFCVLPTWNLKESSKDLLPEGTNEHSYTITEKNYQMKAKLTKTITRTDNTITQKNSMYSETASITQDNVDYEDIESVCVLYSSSDRYVICPNGKYHPIYYYHSNNNLNTLNAGGINNNKDWSLKCYKHDTNFIFAFYLNYGINYYYTAKATENLNGRTHFDDINNIFDFKLNNGNSGTYAMAAIVQRTNGDLSLIGTHISLNTDNGDSGFTGSHSYTKLADAKQYTKACFKSDNYFYYFTYNDASDFTGGYSTGAVSDSDYSAISGIGFHTFDESPFEFVNEVEIQEINFIKTTKYAYYKIKDLVTGDIYHGILDIGWNRVVFNTKESIDTFIPYSDIAMLAITSETAYEVCVLKSGDSCISSCSNEGEGLILDIDKNKCGTGCDAEKIEMLPEHVCVNPTYCDTSIYIKNATHCGLCKYFYPDGLKYSFIKNTKIDCLDTIPEEAEEYNTKLHLLRCKSGYKLENDECVTDCYSLCNTCSEHSDDENSQKCLTCKAGYSLEEETKNCKKIIATTILPEIMIESSSQISVESSSEHLTVTSTELPESPSTEVEVYSSEHLAVASTELPISPSTEMEISCPNEKCLTCNKGSISLDLCLTCNEAKGYKKVNYTFIYIEYLDCIKEDNSKLIHFYYNGTIDQYKPCYKTCKRCLLGGSPEAHNCLECASGYMFRPGDNPHNNCVVYSEYYYMSAYSQYKSLKIFQCPEEAKYAIKDKKMCIDDCRNDKEYKYLFNGNCYKECPSGTANNNYICKVNSGECSFGENELILDEKQDLSIINSHIKNYISEFSYTEKHISLYKNNIYSVIIYKTSDCISELSLEMPNVNFQSCYEKVQAEYGITEKLIVVIVDKIEVTNPSTFYSFYHPKSGLKLNAEEICKNETIVVLENLNSVLDKNNTYYNIQSSLTSQGINVFDINDPFYTDICYDFDNKLKKDIPLNDRIADIFPNATLCDTGCQYEGINLNDMTATCNCKFNDITNNNAIKDNALLDSAFGEVLDLVNSSNILVLKCIKNIFKYFSRSIGGWISVGLIVSHIGLTLTFGLVELAKIKGHVISLTKNYLSLLTKNSPPRKIIKNNKSKMKMIDESKDKKVKGEHIIPYKSDDRLNNKNTNIKNNIKKTNENLVSEEKVLNVDVQDKKFFEEYLSTEPDDMEFDDAIVKDKRSFRETFVENLKDNQIIVNTFITEDPIKVRSIKIILFILNIMLYFVVNGLFFSEEVISELYNVDEEKENFFSFIPRSLERLIYTTLVGIILGIITDFFFIEEIKIKGIFKRDKDDKKTLKENITNLFKEIKKRSISFIIIVSILLIVSSIYLLCFNYVYPYSQMEWIKSSIAIIIIMQVLSFLRCLLETCLRFLSFKVKSEKIYKIARLFD